MVDYEHEPVVVEQAGQGTKGQTIVTIIFVIVLITLGVYGYAWITSDVGSQKFSEFKLAITTKYNPFTWYGEQLKGAGEIGRVWGTESNATAEKIGIDFKGIEAVGSKIIPAGTPAAFRFVFDVGEGVEGTLIKLECKFKEGGFGFESEEEIIEPGSKTYIPAEPKIYTDKPLSSSNILCQAKTKKITHDKKITAEGKVSFPFKEQRGALKVYFTKDTELTGKDFFKANKIEEKLPIQSKYNNEPIELGLGVSYENIQPVVIGENFFPAVGISLKNRWNGKVTKVTDMNLILPRGVTINKENSPPSVLCPFEESTPVGDKYVKYKAKKAYLDEIEVFGRGIETGVLPTYQRFFCWLNADESILGGKPYIDKEYRADVSYEYEFQPRSEEITVKGTIKSEPGKEEIVQTPETKYKQCIDKDEKVSCVTTCSDACVICEIEYDSLEECQADLPIA